MQKIKASSKENERIVFVDLFFLKYQEDDTSPYNLF
jgi:hypothetical protein